MKLPKNVLSTILILVISFVLCLIIQDYFNTRALIPLIFAFAVFIISLVTNGYFYGIISALLSVLAVNFAFTFPFFEFNFTIHENAVSAIIMIAITIVTGTLTTKIKTQEILKAESEKEKMRANLLRAISHDLRTPLTSIYGSCSTIIEHYDAIAPEQQIKMLKSVKEDSKWLIRMVENLLSVTKIENNNVKISKSPVVLEELVDSIITKFKKNYPEANLKLDMPEEFITVYADVILIEQVLINLLENAVVHAKGMTEILLKITKEDNKVMFQVIDDGCGIEKEKLKTIFTGYNLSSNALSDSGNKSMGIGLSVCYTIVKAHGDIITAENRKPKGMIFKFSLEGESEDE